MGDTFFEVVKKTLQGGIASGIKAVVEPDQVATNRRSLGFIFPGNPDLVNHSDPLNPRDYWSCISDQQCL